MSSETKLKSSIVIQNIYKQIGLIILQSIFTK